MPIAADNMRMQVHERVSNLSHHGLNFHRLIWHHAKPTWTCKHINSKTTHICTMKLQHIIDNAMQYGNQQHMPIAVNIMHMQLHECVSNSSHHGLHFHRLIWHHAKQTWTFKHTNSKTTYICIMKLQHIIDNSRQYGNKQQMPIAVNNMRMHFHERV